MDLQRQVDEADQVVTKARAALASAEVEAAAADERLAQERAGAAEAAAKKAAADPFQEKAFLAATREHELAEARVQVRERQAATARGLVEASRAALEKVEHELVGVQLQAAEADLVGRGEELEALCRKMKAQMAVQLSAYADVLARADKLLWQAPQRGERTVVPSDWRRACGRLTEGDGILAAVERVVTDKDAAAEAAARARAEPVDPMREAEVRDVMRRVEERKEEEESERYYRERNKSRSEAISREQLEYFKQQAIDAKSARDGLAPTNPADFTPAVG